jgi:lysophospholipase L1-like esterase
VRVVAPQLTYRFPRGLFVADDATSYRLRPGFRGVLATPEYRTPLHINGQGLRADHHYGPKPSGVTRVLVLGDSFAMGVGVAQEETVAARLERLLDRNGAFEVVNAGVPGYSTVQEVAWLEAYGLTLQPDLVVLLFFLGNDVADNARLPLRVRDGYLVGPGDPPAGLLPVWLRTELGLHSHLYHFVFPRWRRLAGRPELVDGADLARVLRADASDPAAAAGWARSAAALDRLLEVTRARRLRAALVLVPPSSETPVDGHGRDASTDLITQASARIADMARARDLAVLDLLPRFQARTGAGPLYFPVDHHLTPDGTELVAQSLQPFVAAALGDDRRVVAGR